MRKLILVLALLAAPATAQEVIEGVPVVLDGDTLLFVDAEPSGGDVQVRLWGIDSPEVTVWPWGAYARMHLRNVIGTGTVRCDFRDEDAYEGKVAMCFAEGDSASLANHMLSAGFAVVYAISAAEVPAHLELYEIYERNAVSRCEGIWEGFLRTRCAAE